MNKQEEARWITLLSAIDTLDKFCIENKKDFDDIELKIPAIKHYMEETIDETLRLQEEHYINEKSNDVVSLRNKITSNFLHNIISNKIHSSVYCDV